MTELKTVDQYKYLGVNQKLTLQKTINKKSSDMEMKALAYANAILKVTKTVPDKCDVLVRMWENVAIPSILYGSESLPIPLATIEKLQSVQINVGKWILGVPRSTANTFALLELGFKPMLTRIAVAKLNFYLKIKSEDGCQLRKKCLTYLEDRGNSTYLSNLDEILSSFDLDRQSISALSVKEVLSRSFSELLHDLNDKPSLRLLPAPARPWKCSSYISESTASRAIAGFRCMNAGLGNRDTFYKKYAVYVGSGRIVHCPLCLDGPNEEIHFLTACSSLHRSKQKIFICGQGTVDAVLRRLRTKHNPSDDVQLMRLFLGQERGLTRTMLLERGKALEKLLVEFFRIWSTKAGETVPRKYK